jgi:hypothetical protein
LRLELAITIMNYPSSKLFNSITRTVSAGRAKH